MTRPAVVLMAYGSPDRLADVPAYYADIRGGRPVRPSSSRTSSPAIEPSGSTTPTGRLRSTRSPKRRERPSKTPLDIRVLTGMRHWEPRIAGAVDTALELGHDALVGLVLAPHWSSLSIAKYEQLFDDAVAGRAETRFVRAWGTEPGFVSLLADRCRGMRRTSSSPPTRFRLASSRPGTRTASRCSRRPGSSRRQREWTTGRSRSRASRRRASPGSARTSSTTSTTLAAAGLTEVLVCPVGFVSDHLEIRWDLDVEAADRARQLGLRVRADRDAERRPGAWIEVLAGIVRRELAAVAA